MALFFTPPVAPTRPAAIRPSHPGFQLFRHYRSYDAGINVFVVGGVVTTEEPAYQFVTPDKVYLGGHIYTISQAEADLLTAAGYTVTGSVDVAPVHGAAFVAADMWLAGDLWVTA